MKSAVDNRGGHNRTFDPKFTETDYEIIKMKDWPWYIRVGSKKWTRGKIYIFLCEYFLEQEVIKSEAANDLISRLADNHFIRSKCLRAIKDNSVDPKIGSSCAYSALQKSGDKITACMKTLGVYPFPKTIYKKRKKKPAKKNQTKPIPLKTKLKVID